MSYTVSMTVHSIDAAIEAADDLVTVLDADTHGLHARLEAGEDVVVTGQSGNQFPVHITHTMSERQPGLRVIPLEWTPPGARYTTEPTVRPIASTDFRMFEHLTGGRNSVLMSYAQTLVDTATQHGCELGFPDKPGNV